MTLRELSKLQWDAALEAARVLRQSDPNIAEDRARFRVAKDRLVAVLPADTDERDIITQALRWDSLNAFAAEVCMIPGATITREGGLAQAPASNHGN